MSQLNIVSVSQAQLAMANEDAKYANGTVTNGYGQASGVYVTVQKGASADIDVDFTITTISKETYDQWKSEVSTFFTQEQNERLEENYGAFGLAGGFFGGAFGLLFGGGDYNHYKDKSESFHTESNEKSAGFAKSVYNLSTSNFHVTGRLTAIGTSYIPVTVSAYVQVTKIKFNDGKELHVISTDNTNVAQRDGSTQGATSSGKLNMVSL